MSRYFLSLTAIFFSIGLAGAGEATFVKFDSDKKELTIKEKDGDKDKETVLKVNDKSVFKSGKKGKKDVSYEDALEMMAKFNKAKQEVKLEVTYEKDTLTEAKFMHNKKKKGKGDDDDSEKTPSTQKDTKDKMPEPSKEDPTKK